jgi:hypothetical protein
LEYCWLTIRKVFAFSSRLRAAWQVSKKRRRNVYLFRLDGELVKLHGRRDVRENWSGVLGEKGMLTHPALLEALWSLRDLAVVVYLALAVREIEGEIKP